MNFLEQITEDIKSAMKARDTKSLEAVRGIKKELLEAQTKGGQHELQDDEIMKILQKMVKQRQDSAALYKEQNRMDLAEEELSQAEVISRYLPKALSVDEIEAALKEIIAQVGASSPKDMGKVMGVATKQFAGRADGKMVSDTVKRLLAQ
ncbi:MAG: GatB/YqeY domain-containing protein [Marinilabiliaceae bacterium]|nr:GatB/YqeY domain-containing protein [Marinilabiliaceae bacterium]